MLVLSDTDTFCGTASSLILLMLSSDDVTSTCDDVIIICRNVKNWNVGTTDQGEDKKCGKMPKKMKGKNIFNDSS